MALTVTALLPAVASASFWDGLWKISVEGGAPGKMCLKKDDGSVEGKFQSEDPNKHGVISGDLSLRGHNWDGSYVDKGTGDKGKFHAEQGESDFFSGWFKPKDFKGRLSWSGVRTDADIGYKKCVNKKL